MTGIDYSGAGGSTAWQRYLDRTHNASDLYFRITNQAYREYLTGPWPDREAYRAVEQSAWMTYYAAGRDAWQTYRAEMETPPPPPLPTVPTFNPKPGGPVPDEFDQRQETYLASDKSREDAQQWPNRLSVISAALNRPR